MYGCEQSFVDFNVRAVFMEKGTNRVAEISTRHQQKVVHNHAGRPVLSSTRPPPTCLESLENPWSLKEWSAKSTDLTQCIFRESPRKCFYYVAMMIYAQ